MKLHEVPNHSYVRVLPDPEAEIGTRTEGKDTEIKISPASLHINQGEILYFIHIDGMYSLCYKMIESEEGELKPDPNKSCHMAAWTDVEIVSLEEVHGTFERIREVIGRSGYGKDGTGEYRQAALKDMSDEWVKASITFVGDVHPHVKYYKEELEYRKNHGISVPDED